MSSHQKTKLITNEGEKMKNESQIIAELRSGKNPAQFQGEREMIIVRYKRPDERKYKYGIQAWTKKEIEESKIFLNFGGGVKLCEFIAPLYLTNQG